MWSNPISCQNTAYSMLPSRIIQRSDYQFILYVTHTVLLLESGANMKYIQERLGHGSYQITADAYTHVSKRMDQKYRPI